MCRRATAACTPSLTSRGTCSNRTSAASCARCRSSAAAARARRRRQSPAPALAELTALVDSSWLRLRANGRYDMHELVRQYCEEKLETEHETATGEASCRGTPKALRLLRRAACSSPVEQARTSGAMSSRCSRLNSATSRQLCTGLRTLPICLPSTRCCRVCGLRGDMLGWQRSVYGICRRGRRCLAVTRGWSAAETKLPERDHCQARRDAHGADCRICRNFGWLDKTADHIRQLDSLVDDNESR